MCHVTCVTATHSLDDADRAQLRIDSAPHPPIMVLALLQQILVTTETLLLVSHPAAGQTELNVKRGSFNDVSSQCLKHKLSPAADDFNGSCAEHEQRLLPVDSRQKISGAAVDFSAFASEIWLFIKHNLPQINTY